MDPNEALKKCRRAAAEVIKQLDATKGDEDLRNVDFDTVNNLAESFQALDGWIKGGGAMPRAWD